jgi:hypothetical protein
MLRYSDDVIRDELSQLAQQELFNGSTLLYMAKRMDVSTLLACLNLKQ